ncbi:MAG: hypothetical protein RL490_204, partial [Pseudomonadota bacterium]
MTMKPIQSLALAALLATAAH